MKFELTDDLKNMLSNISPDHVLVIDHNGDAIVQPGEIDHGRLLKKYNGWTNYETWALSLWIDNDHGSYLYWREAAQEAYENAKPNPFLDTFDRTRQACYALAQRLKEETEEADPLAGNADFYTDVLGGAISEVDWASIAEHWIDDLDPEWIAEIDKAELCESEL